MKLIIQLAMLSCLLMLAACVPQETAYRHQDCPARCSRVEAWITKGVRETFSRYDSADYLKTEADMAAYLEACAGEAPNDPVFMLKALDTAARARNMSQLAEAAGVSIVTGAHRLPGPRR